jgi:hypothetical protein
MFASYVPFGFDGSGTVTSSSTTQIPDKTGASSAPTSTSTPTPSPLPAALQSKSESDLNASSTNAAYANIVKLLQSSSGRAELGDDPKKLDDINAFLREFPFRGDSQTANSQQIPPGPWTNMSVKQVFRQSIQTAIDIINDVSKTISQRNIISATDYRRELYSAFTAPSRRTYVGIWLIFLSFILYFIDSAA